MFRKSSIVRVGVLTTLIILSSLLIIEAQSTFNRFKSYKNAKVKPRHYGTKVQRDQDISEYLTPAQQHMMRKRTSPDTADVSFDNKWTGFNDKASYTQSVSSASYKRQLKDKGATSTTTRSKPSIDELPEKRYLRRRTDEKILHKAQEIQHTYILSTPWIHIISWIPFTFPTSMDSTSDTPSNTINKDSSISSRNNENLDFATFLFGSDSHGLEDCPCGPSRQRSSTTSNTNAETTDDLTKEYEYETMTDDYSFGEEDNSFPSITAEDFEYYAADQEVEAEEDANEFYEMHTIHSNSLPLSNGLREM